MELGQFGGKLSCLGGGGGGGGGASPAPPPYMKPWQCIKSAYACGSILCTVGQ